MFVGKHTIKKNNLNQLSKAYHRHYGVVLIDGCTILLAECNTDGLVSAKTSKLGVFSGNVVSVAWSNTTLKKVYLSVQLRSQVNLFSVCSDRNAKPVFSQILTFDLQSQSAVISSCFWHTSTTKPVICILSEDNVHVLNVITNKSQKVKCGATVKAGVWTPDGARLIIGIGSILKVFSWDGEIVSDASEITTQHEIGVIRNIETISNDLVAIGTDLPLEQLIKTSADDLFEIEAEKEISEDICDGQEYGGQKEGDTSTITSARDGCESLPNTDNSVSLLRNRLKNKGCIDLTDLLSQVGKVDSMQNLAGRHSVNSSGDSDHNDTVGLGTAGKQEPSVVVDKEDVDLTNIKAVSAEHNEDCTANLLRLKRKQKNVTDCSQLLIINLKEGKALSKVNVPCIISPDILTYLPGCGCLVVGSNSQSKLFVYKWNTRSLKQGKHLELPLDEKPVGVAAVSSATVMVMSAKSEPHHLAAAFLETSAFTSVDVHIRTITIDQDVEMSITSQGLSGSDLPFLRLPTGENFQRTKQADDAGGKMIEEINATAGILRTEFTENQEMFLRKKDVGIQCESKMYPYTSDVPLIHLRGGKAYDNPISFILEEGCYLSVTDVKTAFKISQFAINIHYNWVYLSGDSAGFARMRFKPGTTYSLKECP